MLVSHRKNFIFTKTAKTAGSSVEMYFEPYCLDNPSETVAQHREQFEGVSGIVGFRGPSLDEARKRRWYNHMSAEQIRTQVGEGIWNSYFKFCTIRNPFDMMVSAFHFTEHKNGSLEPDCPIAIERFRNWIAGGAIVTNRERYQINGQLCIDYFVRHEKIQEGMFEVCERLGVAFEPERIPRIHAGIRPRNEPLENYYDARTRQKVLEAYEFEFQHFGYSDCPARSMTS